MLVQIAHAAGGSKNTCLSALSHRLPSRKGKKRAAVAVGHAVLVMMYHLIRDGAHHRELGADYFDHLDRHAVAKRLKKRLETIGFQVEIQDLEKTAA
ncbi:MAG: hypothetical protein AB1445_15915 [Bacillota bacterium]